MAQPASHAVEDDLLYDPQDAGDIAGDVRDPYPDLAIQREANPVKVIDLAAEFGVVHEAGMARQPDMYTVFSYDAVRQVLADNEGFSSAGYAAVMGQVMGHTILEMDAPEHPRHRALVARAFRTRMLQRWGDTLITDTVRELVDRIAPLGRADLVRSLTFPFPVKVIARILGLPDEDWPKFQRWSIELIGVGADWERGVAASAALRDYFSQVVTARRADPRDDLISQLTQAEVDGHRLADDEIYPFLCLLLPAGAETTYRSSGNLIHLLLTHRDQLEAVRADRSLLPQAIEEALRLEPPLLFIMRTAAHDVDVCGVTIPAGSTVGVSLGAANRDPTRWSDPDTFDIFREPKQHISFAAGPHLCLGTHLARLETRVVLDAVLDRLPGLRLDPDAEDPHIHGLTFRSPTSLPVLFDPS